MIHKLPVTFKRRVGLCVAFCAVAFPLAGHAAAGPQRHGFHTSAGARTSGLTLTISKLAADRLTIRKLAAYYYGAAEMSFVIQSANLWLRNFPTDRSLMTVPRLELHPTIRIPTLRGARPIRPGLSAH